MTSQSDGLRSEEPKDFIKRLFNGGLFINDKLIELMCGELKGRFKQPIAEYYEENEDYHYSDSWSSEDMYR